MAGSARRRPVADLGQRRSCRVGGHTRWLGGWRAALSRRGQPLELLLLDDEALDDEALDDEALDDEVLDEELVALLLGLGFAAARESVR